MPIPSERRLGLKVKSGWAAAVLLGGDRAAPGVLDARRIELADPGTPESVQPYHAGFGTARADEREVRRLVRLVERRTRAVVAALLAEYRAAGQAPAAASIVATSFTDPSRITNPHIRIHALEGVLFRRVVLEALQAERIRASLVLEQELYQEATAVFACAPTELKRRLTGLRPADGSAWRSEQKTAALAAWLLLQPRR